jgi:hypothetical protein
MWPGALPERPCVAPGTDAAGVVGIGVVGAGGSDTEGLTGTGTDGFGA